GVLVSWPSQKGQKPLPGNSCSCLGPTGRLARSVAMITQRPTIGSLRNSGIGSPRSDEAIPPSVKSIHQPHAKAPRRKGRQGGESRVRPVFADAPVERCVCEDWTHPTPTLVLLSSLAPLRLCVRPFPLNVPHNLLEVRRRAGQVDGP